MQIILNQSTADNVFYATVVAAPLLAGFVSYRIAQCSSSRFMAFMIGFFLTSVLGVFLGGLFGGIVNYLHNYYIHASIGGTFLQLIVSPLTGLIVGILCVTPVAVKHTENKTSPNSVRDEKEQ